MLKPVEKPIKFIKNLLTKGKSYPITHVGAIETNDEKSLSTTINNILEDLDSTKEDINNVKNMILSLDSNLANTAFIGDRPLITCRIDGGTLEYCTLLGEKAIFAGKDWEGLLVIDDYREYPEDIDIEGNYGSYVYNKNNGTIKINNISSNLIISATAPLYIPYVKEGLVLWLDGINKGPNDDAWTDLIGGIIFPNHGCNNSETAPYVENPNYKLVARENCWESLQRGSNYTWSGGWLGEMGQENNLSFDPSTHTIEGAYLTDSNFFKRDFNLCHFSTLNSDTLTGLYINPTQDGWINGCHVGNTKNVWSNMKNNVNLSDYNPHTISLNKTRAFNNGLSLSSLGVTHWAGNGGGRYIGCASIYNNQSTMSYPKFFTPGKIYSIRVYNRILTQEEILHNLRVDNERFNLGITTIPNE